MLRDSPTDRADTLRRFVERFRDDAGFHELVRSDIQAALAEAGISVPRGVDVGFASNASRALSMTLDRAAAASGRDTVLDDSELLEVVGGAGRGAGIEELRNFLSLFNIDRA